MDEVRVLLADMMASVRVPVCVLSIIVIPHLSFMYFLILVECASLLCCSLKVCHREQRGLGVCK